MNLNDNKIYENVSGGNGTTENGICEICGRKYSRFIASSDKSPFGKSNCCLKCRSKLENKLKNGFNFKF